MFLLTIIKIIPFFLNLLMSSFAHSIGLVENTFYKFSLSSGFCSPYILLTLYVLLSFAHLSFCLPYILLVSCFITYLIPVTLPMT